MSKKKAVICTILFTIVIFGFIDVIIYTNIDVFYVLTVAMSGFWIADVIEKFYKWLTK